MSNVLILGDGYVGQSLFKQVDKDKNNYLIHSRKTLDYSDQVVLSKFILNNDINYVVNCFGFTGRPNVDEGELKKKSVGILMLLYR